MVELQKLCDKVPSFDNAVAMKVIEDELGAPWQQVLLPLFVASRRLMFWQCTEAEQRIPQPCAKNLCKLQQAIAMFCVVFGARKLRVRSCKSEKYVKSITDLLLQTYDRVIHLCHCHEQEELAGVR